MSKKNLYALLVGINQYDQRSVSNLRGCVNDVENIEKYLLKRFDNPDIKTLKDQQATYQNIIQTFRSHLTAKATKDDVVFFHYSGHGAREIAATEFKPFFPEGREETLVCYDSRKPGGHDLADKELAVLINEVAQTGAHVVISLDCCHSGSGTRNTDDIYLGATRKTYDRHDTRPLDTYIDGYYQQELKDTGKVVIPQGKHLLLAACDRKELAKETRTHQGVFTTTLLETLEKAKGEISYADLFLKCRINIVNQALKQTPQFEAISHFNAHSKFLDGQDMADIDRKEVHYEDGEWVINYGAIDGLEITDDFVPVFEIYSQADGTEALGTAHAKEIYPERTFLDLDFRVRTMTRFYAKPISLPAPKMAVYVHGEEESVLRFKEKETDFVNVLFADSLRGTKYNIEVKEDGIYTYFNHSNQLIQGYENDFFDNNVKFTIDLLAHILRWENGISLQNRNTQLQEEKIEFYITDSNDEKILSDREVAKERGEAVEETDLSDFFTLYLDKDSPNGMVKVNVKAEHHYPQKLYFALVYFSEEFEIAVYRNEPMDKNSGVITLWGEGEHDFLWLEDEDEYHDIFKLVVSTEPIQDFLLQQSRIKLGEIKRSPRRTGNNRGITLRSNDWLTKTVHIRLLKRKNKVKETPTKLGDKNTLVIGGHPDFQAKLSLSAAQTNSRNVDDIYTIAQVFSQQNGEMLSFGASHGHNGNVLVLNEIDADESLKEQPLEIDVNVATDKDEMILSFTMDDGVIVPIGQAQTAEDGSSTKIVIDEIPNIAYPDQKRSLKKALKLVFFKFMKWEDKTQQLRKVIYHEDGTAERSSEGVKEAVEKADSILLLVHGIIGDTQQMAEAFRAAIDSEKYDLVLTYDYENLNTSIIDTADWLYNKLVNELKLPQSPDKKLDIVAHSMGGLVSRYMIEKLGGDQMVNHLFMCGTPNNGSAISEVPHYRNMLITLLTLGINFGLAIPWVAGLVGVLDRSKKLTLTLEEMRTEGTFIPKLRITPQPKTTYSIIAGDLGAYRDKSDEYTQGIVNKLLNYVSRTFYGDAPNDIAVSVNSIQGISHFDQPKPKKLEAACHHMNYFTEDGGFEVVRKEIGC